MKRLFIMLVTMLLTISNVDAQSKKELKALAERAELIASTTDADGCRTFKMHKHLPHLSISVQDCYFSNDMVLVHLLIANSDLKDDELYLMGELSSWKDLKGVYRCCRYCQFAAGRSTKFNMNIKKLLIPSQGALKVTLQISDVYKATEVMQNLNISIESKLAGERKKYSPQYGTGETSQPYFCDLYYLEIKH